MYNTYNIPSGRMSRIINVGRASCLPASLRLVPKSKMPHMTERDREKKALYFSSCRVSVNCFQETILNKGLMNMNCGMVDQTVPTPSIDDPVRKV